MPTVADLCRLYTRLRETDVAHLQDLTGVWGLLSDLSFADLLLYVPEAVEQSSSLVVIGHVRPTTGPTLYRADLVGQIVEPSRQPRIAGCLESGRMIEENIRVGSGREISLKAVPVRHGEDVIAVLARERHRPDERPMSEQERTYLKVFDRFAKMLECGEFPYREEERFPHRTPRVGDGLLLVDRDGRIEFASPNAVSVMHRLGMHRAVVGARIDDSGLAPEVLRSAFAKRSSVIEEVVTKAEVTIVSHCLPLLENGRATGAIILVRDVTDLRRRDRLLVSKDATIREVHHRVKNNLQTISSLLRLQARRLTSDEARAAVGESVRRIAAISVVHEALAQSADHDVSFTEIVGPLVHVVEETVSMPERPLRFQVSGDAGVLPAQVATTLAVVVTELIQNAVDHAFVGSSTPENGSPGRVEILLERQPEVLRIDVIDDGGGLPADFVLSEASGLGLTIVRTFVEVELGGTIILRPGQGAGTVAEIRIPAGRLVSPLGDARDP